MQRKRLVSAAVLIGGLLGLTLYSLSRVTKEVPQTMHLLALENQSKARVQIPKGESFSVVFGFDEQFGDMPVSEFSGSIQLVNESGEEVAIGFSKDNLRECNWIKPEGTFRRFFYLVDGGEVSTFLRAKEFYTIRVDVDGEIQPADRGVSLWLHFFVRASIFP